MAERKPIFYGWIIIAAAFTTYGFGISPAYYSWGFLSGNSSMLDDLGFERGRFGLIFGIFTFMYSAVGPLVGVAMSRWGIRRVMISGSISAAVGFFIMSRAETLAMCILGFSLLGGIGVGFSTIVPAQTLGQNWFLKRRALAISIILCGGGVVGFLWLRVNVFVLDHGSWRTGWLVIACASASMAVVSFFLVRDAPESMGLRRDGLPPDDSPSMKDIGLPSKVDDENLNEWTARQAIFTRQFLTLIVCGIAYAVPWGVVASHGPLHLADLGYSMTAAAGIFGIMALVSILGRLSATLGDIIRPQYVLGVALIAEALGMAGFLFATSTPIAYACVTLVGIGFGMAYSSLPVVISHFFGRAAFGTTTGTRIMITGVFNGAGPWISGVLYERTGNYTVAFLTIAAFGIIGSIAAFTAKHPGDPPQEAA